MLDMTADLLLEHKPSILEKKNTCYSLIIT